VETYAHSSGAGAPEGERRARADFPPSSRGSNQRAIVAGYDRPVVVYGVRTVSEPVGTHPFGDFIETFVRREDAERFIADCLRDEPEWVLEIVEVEVEASPN
jgi:hypothetical protein